MKRFFVVAAVVVMAAATAWAQYQVCSGSYAGYCYWKNSTDANKCSAISIMPGESWSKATCQEAYENCVSYGELFSDDACTNKIGGAEFCGDYCDWGPVVGDEGGCHEITTDKTYTTCETAKAHCDKDGARYSNSTCTGTPVGGSKGCGYYCDWGPVVGNEGGCHEIKPDTTYTTCETAVAHCDADGARYSTSTCTGTQVGGDEACGGYCKWGSDCVAIKTDKTGQYNDGVPITTCTDAISNCTSYGQMFTDASCTVTSAVRLVGGKASVPGLKVSYAKNRVSVNWTPSTKLSGGTVQLLNVKGVAVSTAFIKANSGKVSVKLATVGVPTGMYFVHINAVGQNGKKIVTQSAVSIVK